jgi:hypothetical protein
MELFMTNPVVLGLAAKIKTSLDSGCDDFWIFGNLTESLRIDGISCTKAELDEAFGSLQTDVEFVELSPAEVISRRPVFDCLDGGVSEVVSVRLI